MVCVEKIQCLGEYCSCGNNIELNLTAVETGTYEMRAMFNGVLLKRSVQVTENQKVVVPNIFNEDYTFIIGFYKSNGEPAFENNFSIKTIPCINT